MAEGKEAGFTLYVVTIIEIYSVKPRQVLRGPGLLHTPGVSPGDLLDERRRPA